MSSVWPPPEKAGSKAQLFRGDISRAALGRPPLPTRTDRRDPALRVVARRPRPRRRTCHSQCRHGGRTCGGRRDRDGEAAGRAAAGCADPDLRHLRRAARRERSLQRQPAEGAGAQRSVLLIQPPQLSHQHPRPRRALRPDQRRAGAGGRLLRGRRLLRPPRLRHARLPRRGPGGGAARAAGHALRKEHQRRRDHDHHPQTQLQAADRRGAQLREHRLCAGQGLDHRADHRPPGGAPQLLRHPARRRAAQHPHGPGHQRPEQPGPARSAPVQAIGRARAHPGRRLHAPAAERLCAGGGGGGADAATRQPPVRRHRRRPELRAAQLQRLRPPHRHRHPLAFEPGPGRRGADGELERGRGHADIHHRLSLLEVGALQRPGLPRPAGHHPVAGPRRSRPRSRRSSATRAHSPAR